jgi:hypothetical protein
LTNILMNTPNYHPATQRGLMQERIADLTTFTFR